MPAAEDKPDQKHRVDETALLANLPIPVIIHSGDEIHYVNQALLDLTGYETLTDIHDAGGVDALFNSDSDESNNPQGMVLRRADGSEEPVDAHLNAIGWQNGRALMLSLMPAAPASIEVVASEKPRSQTKSILKSRRLKHRLKNSRSFSTLPQMALY